MTIITDIRKICILLSILITLQLASGYELTDSDCAKYCGKQCHGNSEMRDGQETTVCLEVSFFCDCEKKTVNEKALEKDMKNEDYDHHGGGENKSSSIQAFHGLMSLLLFLLYACPA